KYSYITMLVLTRRASAVPPWHKACSKEQQQENHAVLVSLDERQAAAQREVEGECHGYASRDTESPERCHCHAASGSSQGAAALPGVSDRQESGHAVGDCPARL